MESEPERDVLERLREWHCWQKKHSANKKHNRLVADAIAEIEMLKSMADELRGQLQVSRDTVHRLRQYTVPDEDDQTPDP